MFIDIYLVSVAQARLLPHDTDDFREEKSTKFDLTDRRNLDQTRISQRIKNRPVPNGGMGRQAVRGAREELNGGPLPASQPVSPAGNFTKIPRFRICSGYVDFGPGTQIGVCHLYP